MDLSAKVSALFVEYIVLVEKCANGFSTHLWYFVHLREE